MKIKLITTLLFIIATTSYAKDTLGETERMNSKLPDLEYQPEYSEAERLSRKTDSTIEFTQNKKCEEVNEYYVICNGNKYVRSIDTSENLKRTVKSIEQNLDSKKVDPHSVTVPK